jgi:hypothetical protein
MTTLASVQNSVDQLSRARVRLLVQGDDFASAATDDLDRLVAPTQLHAVAQVGEADAAGLRGRVSFGNGVTMLGGFSLGEADYQDIRAGEATTVTLAVRYAPPDAASRPFIEIGGLIGDAGSLTENRTYANGSGTATGRGTSTYASNAVWGRIGWIWDWASTDQLGVYAEFGRQSQSIGGYAEALSNLDPFEAAVAGGGDRMDVGKLGLRYDHELPGGWELFGGLVVAHAFGESQTFAIAVDGFGALPAPAVGDQTWVEYRARVGHSLTARSSLSFYVSGVAGTPIVGDSADVGLDYRVTF